MTFEHGIMKQVMGGPADVIFMLFLHMEKFEKFQDVISGIQDLLVHVHSSTA